jgi:asparagine synthase (glutamine-hydrolysing)
MSGIAGIIHFDGKPVEPGLIEKMTGAMAHRGPDGINHWVKGSVALGQCMLRTTPESLEEHQPLTSEDNGLVLVMDGRVDNWEELRRGLLGRGAVLRTRADAELVLRAYEIWGRDCLAHIDGDFALVIWDARRQEVFCARDRIGNKPLNYHWDGKTFVFASELHAILALPWVHEMLNKGMLAEFLTNEWYSRDETFWKGIMRLVAAHRMVVDGSGLRLEQYWAPDLWATLPYTKDEEYIEHYRELFTDVVRRMSRSCKPVACEVSGGLDSSAIFAVAEHLRRHQSLLAPGLKGYTLAFTDDSDANELDYARAVGDYLGVEIDEVAPTKMSLSWYQEWAHHYREFPSYPNGVMGLGIREKARSDGSRTLLVGVGGDQWLCGGRSYYADALSANQWKTFFACLDADRRDFGLPMGLWWVFRHGCGNLLSGRARQFLRKVAMGNLSDGPDRRDWLTPGMETVMRGRCNQFTLSNIDRTRWVGQRRLQQTMADAFSAHALELEERMAASVGIELRRPFYDSRLIQFAFTTPERLRLRGRVNKYLHRKAMTGLLPGAVLKRESKAEFSIVFQRHLPELHEIFTQGMRHLAYNWVVPGSVVKMYDRLDHDHSGEPEWMLWTLFGCTELVSRL